MDLSVDVGNKIDVMKPDTKSSHGWDFVGSNSGSLIRKMEMRYNNIKRLFTECNKDITKLSQGTFNREVQFLCHYTTDAHTIGQISGPKLWGKKDTKIDFACEFIPNKKLYPVRLIPYSSVDVIKAEVLVSMQSIFNKYYKNALKWNFVFKKAMRSMGREAVQKGAEFAASWVQLALTDA